MKYPISVLTLALAALPVLAGDWTQFRGTAGTAVSDETGLPTKWSTTENVRWKADLPGRGLSSPVVAGGKVFVTASSGAKQEALHVLCFDAATGKKFWQRNLAATGDTNCHPKTCMAAPTPVADGERVYAMFATFDLACFSADGDLLWYRALARDYPALSNQVGVASSPVLWKETLILALETPGESIAAGLDARTGKNVWKAPRPRDVCWTSPVLSELGGKPAVVFQSGNGLTAYNPADGGIRWTYESKNNGKIASTVVTKDLILSPGDKVEALRPDAEKSIPDLLWASTRLKPSMASPLVYRDRYFAVNGTGILVCADMAEGKVQWEERLQGAFSATPLAADGNLYLTNEEGKTFVVRPGEKKAEVLSINLLKEDVMASPAVSGGALFFRSDKDKHLWCIAAPK